MSNSLAKNLRQKFKPFQFLFILHKNRRTVKGVTFYYKVENFLRKYKYPLCIHIVSRSIINLYQKCRWKGKTTTLRISKFVKNKSINNDGYRNMIKKTKANCLQLWFLQNNFNIMIEQEVYMLVFFVCLKSYPSSLIH